MINKLKKVYKLKVKINISLFLLGMILLVSNLYFNQNFIGFIFLTLGTLTILFRDNISTYLLTIIKKI